jgi:histidinol-phosphate aminotransferase
MLSAAAPPLRPELVGEPAYGSPQLDVAVRLDTNENPYPPPQPVVAAITAAVAAAAGGLNRYPDREALALRQDLAAYLGHGLGVDQLWAANGSNEVMLQLLQAYGGPGRAVLSFTPTYSMYPNYARSTGTRWVSHPRGPDFGIDLESAMQHMSAERPDVVVLASPNNPTGGALALETVAAIADRAPGLVIVDEAYAEFRRPGVPSALELLAEHPRLVVTRTMSKAFALAGVRLGYAAADPHVVAGLRVVRLPYHLSTLTQAVARAALRHTSTLLAQVDALRTERDALVEWLRGQGLSVADSDANFVLFGRFPSSGAVWQALLDRGVLIRDTGPAGWLRVSVGTPQEMATFRHALTEALAA